MAKIEIVDIVYPTNILQLTRKMLKHCHLVKTIFYCTY